MSDRSKVREPDVNYRALVPYTPYITAWSEERDQTAQLIVRPGRGIGYLDETLSDRDSHGALWLRIPSLRGHGEPKFAEIHPLRQRRSMRRLLCNVCAGPASQTADGTLWLIKDHRGDWPDWPEDMAVTEPPVCAPCARLASRLCPALRKGAVAVRVRRAPVVGVHGTLYRSDGLLPVAMKDATVAYGNPRIRWVRAMHLVRELHDCTFVPLESLCRS